MQEYFNTPKEKQESFIKELKELLNKYNAELNVEDFGVNWVNDDKIVVDFNYDEELFFKSNTGVIPQIVLGYSFSSDSKI